MKVNVKIIALILFVIVIFCVGLVFDAWDDHQLRSPLAPAEKEVVYTP